MVFHHEASIGPELIKTTMCGEDTRASPHHGIDMPRGHMRRRAPFL